MEDQGEWSPQTFLVNNFSFLKPQRKQDDRHVFKWVFNTGHGFKAAVWTLEKFLKIAPWKFKLWNQRTNSLDRGWIDYSSGYNSTCSWYKEFLPEFRPGLWFHGYWSSPRFFCDQNSDACTRLFSRQIADLRDEHIPGSKGTSLYIRAVCRLIDPFQKIDFGSPGLWNCRRCYWILNQVPNLTHQRYI